MAGMVRCKNTHWWGDTFVPEGKVVTDDDPGYLAATVHYEMLDIPGYSAPMVEKVEKKVAPETPTPSASQSPRPGPPRK